MLTGREIIFLQVVAVIVLLICAMSRDLFQLVVRLTFFTILIVFLIGIFIQN